MDAKRQPTLGVHLLETITRGMYSEPLHCIREYVQNAYDSIRAARRAEVLQRDRGTVTIRIDVERCRVSIRDDGVGLEPEEAAVHLLDIGASIKARSDTDAAWNAGFRGIGRMAGISYCRSLRFETSKSTDPRRCTVIFNADGINRLTERGQSPTTIVDAIERNSSLEEGPAPEADHYLEVTLDGVERDSVFLDYRKLEHYLALSAPVRYDPTRWSHGDAISAIASKTGNASSLDAIEILIIDSDGNRLTDVRRPFQDSFQITGRSGTKGPTIRVEHIQPLPHDDAGRGWWGWMAVHHRPGALSGIDFAGLRIRAHNIAVGDDSIVRSMFTTRHLASSCFGEIHITDPSIVPNAQRDNFEPSDGWEQIEYALHEEARIIERQIRRESTDRNRSLERYRQQVIRTIAKANKGIESGFLSNEQKTRVIGDLTKLSETLSKQAVQTKRTEDEKSEFTALQNDIEHVLGKVESVPKTQTDDALSHFPRQVRRVIQIIFSVLNKNLSTEQFEQIQEKIQDALKPGAKQD